MEVNFTIIDRRPTIDDPIGAYKIIIDGIFWGHFCVGKNWAGQRYVSACDTDGVPW